MAAAWRRLALLFFPLVFLQPAFADARTLTVAVDRSAEQARDLTLLSDQVRQAAESQRNWIDAHTIENGAEVTIGDTVREKTVLDDLQRRFAGRPGTTVTTTSALSFWIAYTPAAVQKYGEEALRNRFSNLEDAIMELRTPLAGVRIEHREDGALVRSRNPGFDALLRKQLGGLFFIEQETPTAWHVAWNGDTAGSLVSTPVEKGVRFFLGEPLDLVVLPNGLGAVFTLTEPDRHTAFIAAVHKALDGSELYVLTETPAAILRIECTDKAKPGDSSGLQMDPAAFEILDQAEEIANPSVDVSIVGDSVWARAKDPVHNVDRAEVIRTALAPRKDLVFAVRPDQSLEVRLVPGAHVLPPRPPVDDAQLAAAIRDRFTSLRIRPARIVPAGPERARLSFTTDTDAAVFRRAVRGGDHVQIRLVDGAENAATAPKPGDEKVVMAKGGFVWLIPGAIVTGDMIAEAKPGRNRYSQADVVEVTLNEEGRLLFAAATRADVGRQLALVVNGVVVTAPYVREPIEGGQIEIDGDFTPEAAAAMAASIMPADNGLPLKIATDD